MNFRICFCFVITGSPARHVRYQAELQAANTADAPDCAAPADVAVDGDAVVLDPYSIHVLIYAKLHGEER